MKPKHLFAFLFATFQLSNFSTVFGQANTYWHDRIDTTIYATTTGTNTYTGTNTNTNFNVNKYVRGLLVSTFFVTGNTTAATYRLVTASGTLATAAIRKQNGAALVSGDIPDSSAVLLMYYGNFWRLMGVHAVSSSAWMLTGNAGTTAGTNFIGTTDAVGFVIKTNNTEWARMLSTGQLGLGTSTPISWLDIKKSANADTLFRASNDANSTFDSTVIILPNGRMGIGTASPVAKLHTLGPGSTSATWTAQFHNSTGTSNTLMIRDDGQIGIRTDAPDNFLSIVTPAGQYALGIRNNTFTTNEANGMRFWQEITGTAHIDNNAVPTIFINSNGTTGIIAASGTTVSLTTTGLNDLITGFSFFAKSSGGTHGLSVNNVGSTGFGADAISGTRMYAVGTTTTSAAYTMRLVNSATSNLWSVRNDGELSAQKSIDATAGDAATINTPVGRFRKDATGTTFTLTNSLITANSIIILTYASDPGITGFDNYIVAGAGSAVITFTTSGVAAAPTNNTDVNFIIIN